MSWPMPNPAQWDLNAMSGGANMNMGTLTPEQWTAMQQQNWQQWSQWQQQYAQWHKQYGDKYAQQMQTFTGMGGIPPPPSTAGPQPPPPPNKPPPPPPPHENNQPLFGNKSQPAPVPPPPQRNVNYTNVNQVPSHNAQWTSNSESQVKQPQAQTSVNSEALKKLAEEERLFDIQFRKWEEEIDKWRKENVNHPDKQAYKEYEQRFEACRAQLMERREQMKQKRSRLMNSNVNLQGSTLPPNVAPPLPTSFDPSSSYNQASYTQQKIPQPYLNTGAPQQVHQQPEPALPIPNRNNNITINTKHSFDSYKNFETNGPPQNNVSGYSDNSSFLPTSSSSKGIPGLDLVPETVVPSQQTEVIDITEEQNNKKEGPDYTTISQGINSILGDEKIMNILSMVRGDVTQKVPMSSNDNNAHPQMYGNQPRSNYGMTPNSHYPTSSGQQQDQYYDQNAAYGSNNMMPGNMGNNDASLRGPGIRLEGPNIRQGGPGIRPGGPNIRQGAPNMRPNGPDMRQSGPNMRQSGPNMRPGGPGMQYGMQHGMQQQGNQNLRVNGPNNQGGPNVGPNISGNQQPQFNNGPRPLMQTLIQRPSRPLQENVPRQQNANANQYYSEPERNANENVAPIVNQPPRPKWVEEPMFTPSIVVEYEHKPLRLKARDFIDPVHTFDYNHKSKDEDMRRKLIEKETEELFIRKPRREREEDDDRYNRDLFYRDERRLGRDDRFRDTARDYRERERPREEIRDDYYRERPREDFDRRRDDRYEERRRDDRDRMRRDDIRDHRDRDDHRDHRDRDDLRDHRDRDDLRDYRKRDEKDFHRDKNRDLKREDSRNRSRSRDRDLRKRGHSKESDGSSNTVSKKIKGNANFMNEKHIVMIDDLLEPPGRDMRPAKIVIILRGPPGSGKSYLAKLIRDREAEYGGTARVMSIDDYFMQEGQVEEKDPVTGKVVSKPTLKYEYDETSEETYLTSLKRAFKRSLTDGYFSFLIYDAVNETLKSYADIWNFARQNNFQVYICTMDLDPQLCYKRNIHNRKLCDIETICARFFPTPNHHIQLDPTTLLQNAAIPDVHMEDVEDTDDVIMEEAEPEVENVFTSKWEKMDDANQLARLDGTNKPLRPSQLSMEDYLQLDEWKPNVAKPGKKTVRWADIEERREQEKMRAIGFVVGQTDWNRMTDPTMGSSALTQTKYIERVKKF